MRTKQALLALSTAIALVGAVSLAQANEPTDSEGGGFKVGPTGQVLGSSNRTNNEWNAYGFVAPQAKHTTHKHTAR